MPILFELNWFSLFHKSVRKPLEIEYQNKNFRYQLQVYELGVSVVSVVEY